MPARIANVLYAFKQYRIDSSNPSGGHPHPKLACAVLGLDLASPVKISQAHSSRNFSLPLDGGYLCVPPERML